MNSKLAKITRMEFKLTAANKAFIILTILGPFLIAAVSILPMVMTTRGSTMGSPELKIAIVSPDSHFLQRITPALQASGIRVMEASGSAEGLDAQVLSGIIDGYVILPQDLAGATRLDYVSKNLGDFRVMGILQGVIGQSVVTMRLMGKGLSAEEISSLVKPPEIQNRQLASTGEKRQQDYISIFMTGLVLMMLIYMTTLLYGQAIGRSVLIEKTSKTVEIMLSSVSPMDLLFGKILGKGLAALLQYAVWIVMAKLLLSLVGPLFGSGVNLSIGTSTLMYLVLFFLLAFFLYSTMYAALGAAAEDEQHLTQLTWPVMIFLILPMVLISPIIMNPNSPFVVVLSLFPLTAPIVMFMRIVVGAAPAWEILVSVALQLATIAGVLVTAAKIFRVGLLMTGKRFQLPEIVRWLRY
jgi:ABC-2 type transport system permease protein